MISSRRLAREWALKILYQRDVGKVTLSEALDAAMERLRKEFVQRGSRTASGSATEQTCLDYLTASLTDTLPDLSRAAELIYAFAAGRVLAEAPYWQEIRLEKSMRTQAPGIPLSPPRLFTPLSAAAILPAEGDPLARQMTALSLIERARLTEFINSARERLPALLDPEMRQSARLFARELAAKRPAGLDASGLQSYVLQQRMEYNERQVERWQKIGAIVTRQVGDWLRTAAFTVKLIHGVIEKQREIDLEIVSLSSGWRLERQVAVDRNILRMAGYEMLFLPGVPTGATINEAVELAKKYSTAESGRFVNGVLGALTAKVGDKAPDVEPGDEADDALDLPDIGAIEENE